nr:hypothetical protein [uncultured Lichenicoccus sp.]
MPELDDDDDSPRHRRKPAVLPGYDVIVGEVELAKALKHFRLENQFLSRSEIEALITAAREQITKEIVRRWQNIGMNASRDAFDPGANEEHFAALIDLLRRMTRDAEEFELTWQWCKQQARKAALARNKNLVSLGYVATFLAAITGFITMLLTVLGHHL